MAMMISKCNSSYSRGNLNKNRSIDNNGINDRNTIDIHIGNNNNINNISNANIINDRYWR